ncbi:MAG TPA: phosphoribosyl-AMP cyclohydrolase [Nitrospinota bacterium]|nr:phosphoribosyl-AMP cyclohydrolase [Nitrospinota bacterium]
MKIINELAFNEKGLMPTIIQDIENNQVLMMAYMNRESLRKTLETGFTHFWSRSRKTLWKKGETSGNVQKVREIYYDCDKDSLLIKVIQEGEACHTGHRTCFFRKIDDNKKEKDKNI